MHPELTVGAMIDRLSAFDRDAPLRLAINPLFALEHTVGGIVPAVDAHGRTVVYIVESGDQLGPVPPSVAVAVNWQDSVEAPPRRRRSATGNQ